MSTFVSELIIERTNGFRESLCVDTTLISLPNSTAFSNAEETEINQQYRKFIMQIYTLIKELSHLDFLSNEEVYRGTSRYEEVPRLDERYTILQESRAI